MWVCLRFSLKAVFLSVSKTLAAAFTFLYPFLAGASHISQYPHVLFLLLLFLGLEEKGEEIGLWEPRGARQEPPCGSYNPEGHSYSLSQGADAGKEQGRQPPTLCTAKPNWELDGKGAWVMQSTGSSGPGWGREEWRMAWGVDK